MLQADTEKSLYDQYLALKEQQSLVSPQQQEEEGLYQEYIKLKTKPLPSQTSISKPFFPTPEEVKEKDLLIKDPWQAYAAPKIKGKTILEHIQTLGGPPTEKVPVSEMGTKEFWKQAILKLPEQAKQFITGLAQQTGYTFPEVGKEWPPYKSVMEEPRGIGEIAKEKGATIGHLAAYLPEVAREFVQNPAGMIKNRPLDVVFLLSAFSPKIRAKLKGRREIKAKDIKETINKVPEEIISSDIKATITDPVIESAAIKIKQPPKEIPGARTMRLRKRLEEKGLEFIEEPPKAKPLPEAEQIAAFEKAGRVEKIPAMKEPKRGELEYLEEPIPGIKEYYAGYPFLKEMKESIRRLKKGELGITPIAKQEIVIKNVPPPVKAGKPVVITEPVDAVHKVINALKEAKPLRKEQEALYTLERGRRFAKAETMGKRVRGEKGFAAEKARLAGELPKVEIESIRGKITQTDVEAMFNQVKDSPMLTYLETFPAREGLAKLLGEYGGKLPTEGELILLNRVFPKEFAQTILKKRDTWTKIKAGILEAANVPRALMASYDLSFGFRQGIFLAARYPKQFSSAFVKQFKLFGSEKAFNLLNKEIASRPTYDLMRRSKLALTEIGSTLSLREEAFMGALWAEKIPVVGLGVRASARAYTGMANKLRADVFDHLIKAAEKVGRNPRKDVRLANSIADFVNTGSGRGSLKRFERSAVILNTLLFSPRLMSSRLKLLNPAYYVKLDPFVRKQALQSLLAFTGAGATVLGLAKAGGLDVEANPFSSDFGKIKIGNTRIDIWGGFQQYVRTAAQFAFGKTVSTTTGKVTKTGEGYKPLTRLDILSRWIEYKQAPVTSFATGLLRGRTVFGEPFNIPKEVGNRFVPMVIADMVDLAKDDPELLPLSTLGIFGFGLQTYKPRKKTGAIY